MQIPKAERQKIKVKAEGKIETRECLICGQDFSVLRYKPQTCCSRTCAKKEHWKRRREWMEQQLAEDVEV